MGDNILLLLSLLGGISLCMYGMKVMSQGILKVAGARMRASMRAISQHRFHSFGVGTWITMLIQSSSAMTVMTVSLVNAGLLDLGQSIAIVMGANVGTTVTAWFIALFGYQMPAGFLAIPLIVAALPFLFTGHIKRKPWGEVLIGVSMMLYGFTTFIGQMPQPEEYPAFAEWMTDIASSGFLSVLLFVALGLGITMLLQSSAATITIAMVLCATGWLQFPMAAAMVIGDNVGTTLTAFFASRKANVSARRAAWAHISFNLFGMVWALAFIYPLSSFLYGLAGGEGQSSPASLALCIALFHTLFNLVSASLLIGFIPVFSQMLCRFLPVHDDDEEEFNLSFIHGGILSTAELSVEEARKEVTQFGLRCQRMLDITSDFINMPAAGEEHSRVFSRIEKYEKITDRLELEIVRYLNSLDRSSMSPHIAARTRSLFREVDELESIGDSCYNIARCVVRRRDHGIEFTQMQQNNVNRMLDLTRDFMELMVTLMQKPELTSSDLIRAYNHEDSVNNLRNQLREQNIGNVQASAYTYQSGVLYMDLVNGCEKLCDYVLNVLQAMGEQNGATEAASAI